MKILFTGISGLIGRYFFESNPDIKKFKIFGTSKSYWPQENFRQLEFYEACSFDDLCRYREMLESIRPDIIVHAGSEGSVDVVQQNTHLGLVTNYEFPLFLLEESKRFGAKVIYFSSNSVFDGKSPPYSESSPANPLHFYGELKKRIDEEVRLYTHDWIILRPIVAYGWNFSFGRKNPVSQYLPLMLEGKDLKIVDDQFENPVYAGDVASILWKCIESGFVGELNIAGGDNGLSRFEWMKVVADVFDIKNSSITSTSMSSFPSLTQRPKDTRFDISKLVKELQYYPLTARDGAEAMKIDRIRTHLGVK